LADQIVRGPVTARGITTPRGGRWHPQTVRRVNLGKVVLYLPARLGRHSKGRPDRTCEGSGDPVVACDDLAQTALCPQMQTLALSKGHMSRLWSQKAFLNSAKTAGRAKGIGSQAFAKFPATHRLRRRLAVVSSQQEAHSQRGGVVGSARANKGPALVAGCLRVMGTLPAR
jgi:hypothetical protein